MIETMINDLMAIVQSMYMVVQHQVDGSIDTAITSTSTTTMKEYLGLLD